MEDPHDSCETGSSTKMESEHVSDAQPQEQKGRKTVMTSHISAPPIEFADGDEGNPRNWTVKKKALIGTFVIVCGFVASVFSLVHPSPSP